MTDNTLQNIPADSYQVLVCNIYWNYESATSKSKTNELPTQLALDIPENVLNQTN